MQNQMPLNELNTIIEQNLHAFKNERQSFTNNFTREIELALQVD